MVKINNWILVHMMDCDHNEGEHENGKNGAHLHETGTPNSLALVISYVTKAMATEGATLSKLGNMPL